MKGKLSTVGAVLSGLCACKVCCILPSLLCLLGVAGSGAALAATQWVSVGLLGVSLLLMARSFYTIYVLHLGSPASRWMTWLSAVSLTLVWTIRLAQASPTTPPSRPQMASQSGPKPEAPKTCPACRSGRKGLW
jgi:hypothetical protein